MNYHLLLIIILKQELPLTLISVIMFLTPIISAYRHYVIYRRCCLLTRVFVLANGSLYHPNLSLPTMNLWQWDAKNAEVKTGKDSLFTTRFLSTGVFLCDLSAAMLMAVTRIVFR